MRGRSYSIHNKVGEVSAGTLNYDFTLTIEKIVRDIEQEYRRNKGLILTESDLAGLIYCRLRSYLSLLNIKNNSGLTLRMRTQDQHIFASPVHLEVPWYDDEGKLTIRPDITILEPSQMSIFHRYGDGLRLPSKQFEFAGDAIIMELKFIRYKSGITPHAVEEIRRDFDKIENLIQRRYTYLMNSLYCFFVVFNKTDNRCPEFDEFLSEHEQGEWYKYEYGTGKVKFND